MKLNPLSAALLSAGVAVVGTAGAIELPHWFKRDEQPTLVAQAAPQGERVVPATPMSTAPGQVPNYRAIVKQSAPAVVGVNVEGRPQGVARRPGPAARHRGRPVLQVLPRHSRPAWAPEPADAVQGHGLGLHHQLRRRDPDQRARRPRRQGRHRQAERPARIHGQGARHRHRDRHRRAEGRRQGPAGRAPRRPEEPRGRRPGARDRRAVRPRADGDLGHRQRQGPLAARRRGRARSSRPTRRSTPATRAARCSTARRRWSASTRRSTRAAAASRACRSRSRSTSR